MMKWILTVITVSLVIASVYACVFPDKVELWYPINIEKLNESNEFKIINNALVKEYDEFIVSVSKEGVRIVCTKEYFNCINNKTFRTLLDEMESYGAFDLSKEDKDTIASLFERNVIIKKLERKDLLRVRVKEFIMRFLGRFFCVNYEKVKACKDEWCSLTVEKSNRCPILKC